MSSARSAKKKAPASARSTGKSPAKKSVAAKKAPSKRPAARKSVTKKNPKKLEVAATEVESEIVIMCRQLAELVESHTLSELIVDTEDLSLTIRRGLAQSSEVPMMASALPAAMAAAPLAATTQAAPSEAISQPADEYHQVTSPFVGTFYRSPNPESPPYCEVGQRVEKGQVLCIVEAMKLMNEIEADVAGTLEAVLVENSEPVEYGQSLFSIKP